MKVEIMIKPSTIEIDTQEAFDIDDEEWNNFEEGKKEAYIESELTLHLDWTWAKTE